jgi:hypothetical protein
MSGYRLHPGCTVFTRRILARLVPRVRNPPRPPELDPARSIRRSRLRPAETAMTRGTWSRNER